MDEDQVVTEHPMQENVDEDIGLRRSIRIKKPAISFDYVEYLQESDYDIEMKKTQDHFHKP